MRAVGYGMVTAGSILWGLNGPISRMALDAGVKPEQLAGWRVISAALLLTGCLVLVRKMQWRVSRRALKSVVLFGILGISVPQLLYYEAIARFDVGLTLVIVYTAPLWVAGFQRLAYGTRQPREVLVAMVLALVGVTLAVGGDIEGASAVGFVLAVCTSLAYTLQLLLAERLDADVPAAPRLALSMIFAAVVWLVVPVVHDVPTDLIRSDVPFGTTGYEVPLLLLIGYVVIGGTILPYACLVGGVARIGPVAAGVTGMVEPIVAIVLSWVLLGQDLTPVQVAGIAIVLTCVVASERARSRALAVPA
jgi:drug/metabolite transporter (DMT)-like permease